MSNLALKWVGPQGQGGISCDNVTNVIMISVDLHSYDDDSPSFLNLRLPVANWNVDKVGNAYIFVAVVDCGLN